jgi:gas vesicle protein
MAKPRGKSRELFVRICTRLSPAANDVSKHLEKTHEGTAKDYNKLAKTIDLPFKDRGVFEQSGIQDIFAGLQQNASKLSSDYTTHAKSVDNTLVKSAKTLSSEIKDFIKRLEKDGVKGGKTVTKNQTETQKHIDLLGSHISKSKGGSSIKPTEDPFITHRGVLSRLDGQVQDENAHHSTLIALQNECAQFESKIVRSIQDMVSQMSSQAASQAQTLTHNYQQLSSSSSAISPAAEWNGFVKRDRSLADPNAAPRTAKSIVFAGSDHELTKPVIEGDLLRKGTVIKKYNSAYYVLTASGFLHEFKSKSYETDPDPAWSLDIKTSQIGPHSAPNTGKAKWTIAGKTKGLMSSKHDFQFQATSYDDMLEWWTAIRKFAASAPTTDEVAADDSDSEPVSPVGADANINHQPTSNHLNQTLAPSAQAHTADVPHSNAAYAQETTNTTTSGTPHTIPPTTSTYTEHPQVSSVNQYAEATQGHVGGNVPSAAHGAA